METPHTPKPKTVDNPYIGKIDLNAENPAKQEILAELFRTRKFVMGVALRKMSRAD